MTAPVPQPNRAQSPQSPKPSQPPKPSAGAAAAKPVTPKPPTPTPPTPPAKKKRGCLPKLVLLLILLAGASYVIYRYPQHIEKWTGWQPPALPSWLAGLVQDAPGAAAPKAAKIAKVAKPSAPSSAVATLQPSSPASPATTQASAKTVAASQTRLTALENRLRELDGKIARLGNLDNIDEARKETRDLSQRLFTAEEQLAAINRQLAVLSNQQHNRDANRIQLQLIDTQLQLNGDTTTAAAALRRLADLNAEDAEATLYKQEAARLDAMPSRTALLKLLDRLQDAADEAAAVVDVAPATAIDNATLQKFFSDILKVRRETDAPRREPLFANDIPYVKWLLLSGQSERYWQALQQLAATKLAADGNYQQLIKYGAPDYRLQLP